MKEKIILFIFAVCLSSCLRVQRYPSKAIIEERVIDTTLNDSSLIYGAVYRGYDENVIINARYYYIGTMDSSFYTMTDKGYFYLKMPAGTYDIICKDEYDMEFAYTLKDLSLLPNEKVKIKFIYGCTIW